jgi:hypothetical protein
MGGRKKGLDGGIGTATHVIHTWTDQAIDEWLREYYALNEGVVAGRDVRDAVNAFVAAHFAHIFCTVCGEEIVRGERNREAWGKVRKCGTCIASGRKAGSTKFCRMCKTTLVPEEADARCSEESAKKGWATRATCDRCKEVNEHVARRAQAMAATILPAAMRAYRSALKRPAGGR